MHPNAPDWIAEQALILISQAQRKALAALNRAKEAQSK